MEMIEQQKQFVDIENLRNYPAEVVDELRRLLASDAPARPDPHRAVYPIVQVRRPENRGANG